MMKQLTKTMIIAIAVIIPFCFASCKKIKGNGDVITDVMTMSQFDGISLSSVFDATIVHSDDYKVVIEAESNIMPYIVTEVKNKTLKLRMKPNISFHRFKDIKVTIYCDKLESITSSGASTIFAENIICLDKLDISTSGADDIEIANLSECKNLKLELSGSGKVEIGNVICDNYEMNMSGAGNVSLAGECHFAKINMSGAGKYNAFGLNVNKYNIEISGAGDAMVTAIDELTVRLSGAGNVNYRGNPQLNISNSGIGRVINKN